MIELRASVSPGELRVAAWDGRLVDYAISRSSDQFAVNSVHRGRVIARVPAMAGAFVALDGIEGFLPDSEMGPLKASLSAGTVLGVRVSRSPQGGKGPRLAAQTEPLESGPPGLLAAAPDALDRMLARYPEAKIRIDDAARAGTLPAGFKLVTNAFGDEVEQALAELAASLAPLPGGASMTIHPTPALVAIDVDLGSQTAQRRDKEAAQAMGNRALIPELCRQIRLRNLSGAIVVDLAGMTPRKRHALAPDFVRALAQDPLAPKFLGFSALGLAEILRPRVYPPLHECLMGPHARGLAALRALDREAAAQPHLTLALRCSPALASALRQDAAARTALADRTGRPLLLIEDRAIADDAWSLETNTRG
jgi:ribonuclease G